MSGRILWNEGRVVGLSAYEIFVRHVLGKDPNATVPSELAWLTSVMSNGSALLLQVGSDAGSGSGNVDGTHYIDVELPLGSGLWATNTIVGSCFIGTGGGVTTDHTGWCTKVVDYGPLIQNDSTASPTTYDADIPPTTAVGVNLTDLQKEQMLEYAKIVDGIVYQPGTWSDNPSAPPQKTEVPKADELPHIRILLKDKVTTTFYVLLTGFTYKGVFDAIADYSHQGTQPENGDFLGPASWAWANKIVFTAPSNLSNNTDIEVVDLANLYIYNTKYLWFYSLGAGGADPSQTDLANVTSINGVQVISGYVSRQFINTYCVTAADAVAASAYGKLSSVNSSNPYAMPQLFYVRQIKEIYGDAALANYGFFFQKQTATVNEPSQQGMFWVVELSTGRIIMTISSAENNVPTLNADRGFNFSATDITVNSTTIPKAKNDIMGSFYGVDIYKPDSNNELGNRDTDVSGTYVFSDYHPVQHAAIKEYALFGKPNAAVPLPPSQYGYDFTTWLSATPIKSVISDSDTIADTIFDAMGVHADYRDLDAQSFLQYAATERDLRLPISTDYVSETTNENFYLFTANVIGDIISQTVWTSAGYTATERFQATFSKSDFFKPAKMIAFNQNNENITRQFTDSAYHLWGANTKVGNDETISLSLTDSFGALLPMGGTQGTLNGDSINWDMISASLSQNKAIDVLGDSLRAMKASKDNYIKMGNGLRLYISSTEPTDTDVPEGSVGLGWNGVMIYTSGAWT